MRTVILGGPKTGKTTLSQTIRGEVPVHHADDYIPQGWSEASETVAGLFCIPGPWIVEGVSCARALRKWLNTNPDPSSKPCDRVLVLTRVHVGDGYTNRHDVMARGVMTVFQEIEGELLSRGVEIIRE